MDNKIGEYLENYSTNDLALMDNAISSLNSLVETMDSGTRIMMFPRLEEAAAKFKSHAGSIPGLATHRGWIPLNQVLTAVVNSGNSAQQERTFAVLVQLLEMAKADAVRELSGEMAKLVLQVIGGDRGQKSPPELREAALHSLKTLLGKFPTNLPPALRELYAELQCSLLAILPDKSCESIRELSAKCMGQLVKFHSDPDSLFSVLSDMSDDCELMLKDDPLLDDLIDMTFGRQNELREQEQNNGQATGKSKSSDAGHQ